MPSHVPSAPGPFHRGCCPSRRLGARATSRRGFLEGLGGAALAGAALGKLSWPAIAEEAVSKPSPARAPLVVKPILLYSVFQKPSHPTSWRPWGGIQTQADADQETVRIRGELDALRARADFPVEFLPLSAIRRGAEAKGLPDIGRADAILLYASAGDGLEAFEELGKDVIVFCRYRSGPTYLWYEIVSPRFLRQHTDALKTARITDRDVVVDSQDDILWRLRALGGLKNTIGAKIVALGGPGGWATPDAPRLAVDRWKLDIRTVTYEELGKLIQAAKSDPKAVERARRKAADYLAQEGIQLETDKVYVERAFILEEILLGLMATVGARAFTINACMGTIMGVAETTACLTLSTLNDAGYLAFCESDFVVVPSGILLSNISGNPPFLNDPTYPYGGIITLAHCTAPRKMDGKNFEPARILTHFESDFGAAPKVEMHKGQRVTNIIPDFKEERWVGLGAEIVDHPFFPICRSQIDVRFSPPSELVADRMPGFHWMTIYGDYLKEAAYALGKTKIRFEVLG